ncbi:SusF/SusE family outer membrane protein [Rhodohalobacter mucosus]|uniref:SusF/SusE family outer membrane protein n=1 Tax=Rhodohalobacter mucosus TaxID=2079485 RepID=UPI001FA8E6CB|nr:SusF/SusE family outer membrane protein [Rhodohalobacter mucosus]
MVIGILIALQVNNWNEQSKLDTKFKSTIEKVYNDLLLEEAIIKYRLDYFGEQISMMDTLLSSPDYYRREELPGRLLFVDLPRTPSGLAPQNAEFNMSLLDYSELNVEQSKLANKIFNYGLTASNQFNVDPGILETPIEDLMISYNIPTPPLSPALNDYQSDVYRAHFTNSHFDRAYQLLNSNELKTTLTTQRVMRIGALVGLTNARDENISLRNAIRDYFPDVSFIHQDIGIVGSALPAGWEPANKLSLTADPDDGFIFQGIFSFEDGEIKFVANDTWVANWGATPAGDRSLAANGQNISVGEGTYRVVVNFDTNRYSITPFEDE